jgi:hypothetical protein
MKKTYNNKIGVPQTIKCNKCGLETPLALTFDNWCIIDKKEYCMKCQKELKIGWYIKKNHETD